MAADPYHPPLELAGLVRRLDEARRYNLGFPGATDFDYTPLAPLFATYLLNNVGDPYVDGAGHNHTKPFERQVIDLLADLFRAPTDDRWGYVTSGGSEGNLYALRLARTMHPTGVLYFSDSAHYSIEKCAGLLRMETVRVMATQWGEIDYDDLSTQLNQRRDRPAIVVATAGTTMAEAVDDTRTIGSILDELAIRRRFLHVDAALAGIPLALLDPGVRPGFDFADGADSITISGHKFLGSPIPSGVIITRASHHTHTSTDRAVSYTATPDTTISGSRSGHAPLLLWHALTTRGHHGLHQRAQQARHLATYTHQRLIDLGWPAHHHRHAFTVLLRTPPDEVTKKWVLASTNGFSHIITMPGIHVDQIDEFIGDLEASLDAAPPTTGLDVGSAPLLPAPMLAPRPRTPRSAAPTIR